MASFSRGLRSISSVEKLSCSRCLQFSTTSTAQSGHSRWSKIKHDKGTADARRSKVRWLISNDIAFASKTGGPNPALNSKLQIALDHAKKASFPKAAMEAAILRGQGKSASGAALEYVTLESMVPPTIAMIIEAETDHSKRTLSELRYILTNRNKGTVTPTKFLFEKKGRVAFEKDESRSVDDILDEAIEAGAEDVETDEDGGIVVWTEPNKTTAAAQALEKKFGLKVESSNIIWDANEDTKVPLEQQSVGTFMTLLDALQDHPNVQGLYANVSQGNVSDDIWEEVQDKLTG